MTEGNNKSSLKLKEAVGAEIISLMDNSLNVLSTIQINEVKNVREWTKKNFRLPITEHGFSMLIRIFDEKKVHSILFDAGGGI